MRGERNALFQNRKLITWKQTGYCEANAERVLKLRYMRKTTETPAKAFNGKYTTRFIINTALGVKSYNSGRKRALWKYIFF